MTTKKTVESGYSHQAQIIEAQASEINHLHKTLQDTIEARNLATEGDRQSYQWYQDAKKRVQFLEKCLSKLRYVIALDIVQDGTHRSRNEYWRNWQQTIQNWLSLGAGEYEDMDDIPF